MAAVKTKIVNTTEILLADIADSLRILAKRPRLEIDVGGQVTIPDEKPKRADAPKKKPAKVEDAGAPAEPAPPEPVAITEGKEPKPEKPKRKRKSGRKKK